MKSPLLENEKFVQVAAPMFVGFLFLLLWEAIVRANDIPPYILPGPLEIGKAFVEDWGCCSTAC